MLSIADHVSRSVVYDEFLAPQELWDLVRYAQAREADFNTSQVHDPEHVRDQYRRSRVLMDTGTFHDLFHQRIAFYLPRILRSLQHSAFEVTRMESQITASNDGDYFRMHNDNTHANWPTREITFVYFFHREPLPFTGGELVLYDSLPDCVSQEVGPIRRRVTPQQNSIIFFPSSILHEILPVHCRARRFEDSRFTLNGWLHC